MIIKQIINIETENIIFATKINNDFLSKYDTL
jgi:hypothetical protein